MQGLLTIKQKPSQEDKTMRTLNFPCKHSVRFSALIVVVGLSATSCASETEPVAAMATSGASTTTFPFIPMPPAQPMPGSDDPNIEPIPPELFNQPTIPPFASTLPPDPLEFPGCSLPDEQNFIACPDNYNTIPGLEVVTTIPSTNRAPTCSNATLSAQRLWPANHQMIPVTIGNITDPDGDVLVVEILAIEQDEPIKGLGSGDTSPDAIIGNGGQLQLRAERAGQGNGRVYVVSFVATDPAGLNCTSLLRTQVPKNNSTTGKAIDNGTRINSLQL
jgi:hypothetical protein